MGSKNVVFFASSESFVLTVSVLQIRLVHTVLKSARGHLLTNLILDLDLHRIDLDLYVISSISLQVGQNIQTIKKVKSK